jgi:hypothetical protein
VPLAAVRIASVIVEFFLDNELTFQFDRLRDGAVPSAPGYALQQFATCATVSYTATSRKDIC